MTFPSTGLVGLDSMAVGASNDALMALNFCLDSLNRFQLVDVRCLAFNVVDVKGSMVRFISTVNASRAHLEFCKPLLYALAIFVSSQVYTLPITRLLKSPLAPLAPLFRGRLWALRSRTTGTQGGTVFCAIALGGKRRFANDTGSVSGRCIFPGRHGTIISHRCFYPCKLDIFEATYERVGMRGQQ